jgi:hypothetical protein
MQPARPSLAHLVGFALVVSHAGCFMVSRWLPSKNMRLLLALFVGASAISGMAGAAASADLASGAESLAPAKQWKLSFTPYGWLPWLRGEQTVKGRTVELDVDPIQVINHLERVPFMGYAEARNGQISLYSDIFYANLGLTASGVRSRTVRPEIGGTLAAALGVDFEETVIEAGGAYEITKWGSSTAVDILAGARYWQQDMSINLALTGGLVLDGVDLSKGIAIARGGSVDWVDPLVGGRVRHQLGPGQELMLRADVGGFGVGSQFSWNALAAYSWEIAVRDGVTYSGLLGYRALDVDYEQGSGRNKYEYNVLQHGPVTGLTIGF